jgi:hypothetical protein
MGGLLGIVGHKCREDGKEMIQESENINDQNNQESIHHYSKIERTNNDQKIGGHIPGKILCQATQRVSQNQKNKTVQKNSTVDSGPGQSRPDPFEDIKIDQSIYGKYNTEKNDERSSFHKIFP